MPRIKRAADYINALCISENKAKSVLGNELKQRYKRWLETLNLQDFLLFIETIKENREKIGVPQFFGKFRAYAFEEYVYRLIATRVAIPKSLQLFWGEKCTVLRENGNVYAMEFDVSIGKKAENFVDPLMVFETKVELDSARLKTALASFILLKQWNPKAKCILVYLIRDVDTALLRLAKQWADGMFHFSSKKGELDCFVEFVNKSLSEC
ncbi:MAG: hypothetical protein ACP5IM_05270 [Candidatus Bathyarchaeia archaeon]